LRDFSRKISDWDSEIERELERKTAVINMATIDE
jgi:hypothetical protein